MRSRLRGFFAAWAPLLILGTITLLDEFDAVAFRVLITEIRDLYGLSQSNIALIGAAQGIVVLLSAVPVALLADRWRKVSMVWIATAIWGLSVSLVGSPLPVGVFVIARFLIGSARAVNTDVHSSLLADFYPGKHTPTAIGIHRILSVLGTLAAGPVAAMMFTKFGLRPVFVLIALPSILLVFLAARIREPNLDKGQHRRSALTLVKTYRTLRSIPTMRRLWAAAFLIGAGLVPSSSLTFLLLEEVYAVGVSGRGLYSTYSAVCGVIGYVIVINFLRSRTSNGRVLITTTVTGISLHAIGLLAMGLLPTPAGLAAGGFTSVGGAILIPPLIALIARVAPIPMRTSAIAFINLFTGAGGLLLSQVVIRASDIRGLRVGMILSSGFVLVGAIVALKGLSTVVRDSEYREEDLAPSPSKLATTNLTVVRDGVVALEDVSLEIQQGECVAISGRNGSGKSTLLMAIAGVVGETRGRVILAGHDVTFADELEMYKLGCHFSDSDGSLLRSLTVAEHLRLSGRNANEVPDHLKDRGDQKIESLSGGQNKLLSLDLAVNGSADLLLLDEVFLGLTEEAIGASRSLIHHAREMGKTLVLVDQSPVRLASVADRMIYLDRGRVIFDGDPTDFHMRSSFSGRALKNRPTDAAVQPLLQLQGVQKFFGDEPALREVSLEVNSGERVGVIGPNGSGKTTLLNMVAGRVDPDRGRIFFQGRELFESTHQRARRGVALLPQSTSLWPSLTVKECLMTSMETGFKPYAFACLLKGATARDDKGREYRANEILELLDLHELQSEPFGRLSTGWRRRVQLGVVIAQDASLLLLDEPSAGVAEHDLVLVASAIDRLAERGISMLIAENHISFVESLADRTISL